MKAVQKFTDKSELNRVAVRWGSKSPCWELMIKKGTRQVSSVESQRRFFLALPSHSQGSPGLQHVLAHWLGFALCVTCVEKNKYILRAGKTKKGTESA